MKEELSWQEYRERDLEKQARERDEKSRPKGLTPGQDRYLEAMRSSILTLCTGPAGTGKTWLSCAWAAQGLREKLFERVVLSRPIVECGRGMGFLPGDVHEKTAPYLRPLLDALIEQMGEKEAGKLFQEGRIEFIPLEHLRGSTFKNALVVLDESQNCEYQQLYMILTRLGQGSRMVISGDISIMQTDLKGNGAFKEVCARLEARGGHKDISVVRLGREDIVRHPLVRFIDERLTGEFLPETPEIDDDWFQGECPACKAVFWYEDPDGTAEDARCFRCDAHVVLLDKDGNYVESVGDGSAKEYKETRMKKS